MAKTPGDEAARAGTLLPATPRPRAAHKTTSFPAGLSRLDQIRRVGCQLLFEHGYAGMTMRQIAARLHVKAASLYYHFPSKQDILFDLMRTTASELLEGLRKITETHRPAQEQLEEAIRWHVVFHAQKQEEAFISHSELRSLTPSNLKAILKLRQEYDRLFDSILKRGQQEGVFAFQEEGVVRNCILTMCTAVAGWFSPHGRLTAEEIADQVWRFIWTGLDASANVSFRPEDIPAVSSGG